MKFKGFLASIIAGSAVGLFFAPKAGKEVRDGIKKERAAGGTGLNELGKSVGGMSTGFFSFVKKIFLKFKKFVQKEIEEKRK